METTALRDRIFEKLRGELPHQNLYDLASKHGVTIRKGTKLNKGWVGKTLEEVAGLRPGNTQNRDGDDFELKSTTMVLREGLWRPKETIKVTQLNPSKILEEDFESSALWIKLERLILVGVHHETDSCHAVHIGTVDLKNSKLAVEIKAFWEDVKYLVANGEVAHLEGLGRSDDFIQLRPTGTGKEMSRCPLTGEKFAARAFYATKRFIQQVLS